MPYPLPTDSPQGLLVHPSSLTKSFLLRVVLKMFQIASLTALTQWDGHGKQCPIHCGNPDQALWEERVWEFLRWLCTSRRGQVGGGTLLGTVSYLGYSAGERSTAPAA